MRRASVIIPLYNRGSIVPEAIESVLAQTGVDVEVVVVDDHSTDASLAVVEQLAGQDSRIVVDSLAANGGPAVARNRAFELATHDVITFLDSDDLMPPDRLTRQIDVLESHPNSVVTGLQEIIVQEGVTPPETLLGDIELGGVSPYIMSMCATRETFDHLGRFDVSLRIGEDLDYLFRCQALGIPVVKLDETVVYRRVFGDNLVNDSVGVRIALLRAVRRHKPSFENP